MTTNPFDQQSPIDGIKHIIAIGSGKGGVGKSTITSNLALALAKKGAKVGILDADIHGPSIPRIFGAINQKPMFTEDQKMIPISRLGLKIMSIGFIVEEDHAVVWRGPMLFKAVHQFLRDVEWGELDYLLIDMPPGTGDIQLTIAQKVPVSGAITVCTPQNLALIDVKKFIDMFDTVKIPHIGLIENMSYLIAPESKEKVQLFPKGELDSYLEQKGLPKLGEIPFNLSVSISSEAGIPIIESHPTGEEGKAFSVIAERIKKTFT